MSTYKNTSPAKKLRGIKRLLTFLQNKSQVKSSDVPKSLSIYQQPSISIFPSALKPKLIATFQSSMDIPPTTQEKPKLQVVKTQSTSIPPRPIYHPAIINASDAMFSKHPSQLVPEEVVKFNAYRSRKQQIGEPLETEIIYQPIGGIRTCLHCGEITYTKHLRSCWVFLSLTFKRFFS
jgi:hypothetical protein